MIMDNFKIICILTALMLCRSSKGQSSFKSKYGEESLFNWGDNSIIQVNSSTFDEYVLNQSTLGVVIAYSLNCGHCHNYAPMYTFFAHRTYPWRQFVRLYVLRCDQNTRFCVNMKITQVPATRVFAPYSISRMAGHSRPTYDDRDKFENMIINDLKKLAKIYLPDDILDAFNPLPTDIIQNRQHLVNFIKNKTNTTTNLIITEQEPFMTSQKLVLDLWKYQDDVRLFILPKNSTEKYDMITDEQNATLQILFEIIDEDIQKIFSHRDHREFKKIILEKYLSHMVKPVTRPSPESIIQEDLNYTHPVYTRDLNNALRYAFFHEIVRLTELDSFKIKSLANFTEVLARYFPWDNENTRRFLKRVNQWLQDRKNRSKIQIDTLKATLKAGSEGFLPVMQPYISCEESEFGIRGYPCSLWLLFHTLTVREYEVQISKMQLNKTKFVHKVLPAMKSYITSFFSCIGCAKNFAEESKNLETVLKKPEDSVIWLWETHNRFNYRLTGHAGEDPYHPKRDFPTSYLCNNCKTPNASWNREEVFKFLLKHYSHRQLHRAGKIRYTNRGGSDLGVDLTFEAGSKWKKNGKEKLVYKKIYRPETSKLKSEINTNTSLQSNFIVIVISALVTYHKFLTFKF